MSQLRLRGTLPTGCGMPVATPIDLVICVPTQQQAIPHHVVDRALYLIEVVLERQIALLD